MAMCKEAHPDLLLNVMHLMNRLKEKSQEDNKKSVLSRKVSLCYIGEIRQTSQSGHTKLYKEGGGGVSRRKTNVANGDVGVHTPISRHILRHNTAGQVKDDPCHFYHRPMPHKSERNKLSNFSSLISSCSFCVCQLTI